MIRSASCVPRPECHVTDDLERRIFYFSTPLKILFYVDSCRCFPGGARKKSSYQCRKLRRHGFNPWVGKIPYRKWQPLQYPCLENSMDRGAWHATVCGMRLSTHDSCMLLMVRIIQPWILAWETKWAAYASEKLSDYFSSLFNAKAKDVGNRISHRRICLVSLI